MADSNKDEAARCVRMAEAALASGDKERVLKFIRIARRLDCDISVEGLLAACEKLSNTGTKVTTGDKLGVNTPKDTTSSKSPATSGWDQNYTEDHAKLIREICRCKDYYEVLGVEKSCSGEEIRRAYRKLSLKVHPDKNKAPGAEEAFKTICKAFKCLSNGESRRVYDQRGSDGDFEIKQHYGRMRRRRTRAATTTRNDLFEEDFDPDEVFRSFFGYQEEVFRARHLHRTRGAAHQRRNNDTHAEGLGFINLLQILPIFIIFVLAFLPYSEPEYFLRQSYTYHIPKITEKHGVEYYVRSEDFDQKYPQGSPSREKLEDDIFRDYRSVLKRYCNIELQRRQRLTNYPTPYCDKLRSLISA